MNASSLRPSPTSKKLRLAKRLLCAAATFVVGAAATVLPPATHFARAAAEGGTTVLWDSSVTYGDWNEGSNWSGGASPTSKDDAFFFGSPPATDYLITGTPAQNPDNLQISAEKQYTFTFQNSISATSLQILGAGAVVFLDNATFGNASFSSGGSVTIANPVGFVSGTLTFDNAGGRLIYNGQSIAGEGTPTSFALSVDASANTLGQRSEFYLEDGKALTWNTGNIKSSTVSGSNLFVIAGGSGSQLTINSGVSADRLTIGGDLTLTLGATLTPPNPLPLYYGNAALEIIENATVRNQIATYPAGTAVHLNGVNTTFDVTPSPASAVSIPILYGTGTITSSSTVTITLGMAGANSTSDLQSVIFGTITGAVALVIDDKRVNTETGDYKNVPVVLASPSNTFGGGITVKSNNLQIGDATHVGSVLNSPIDFSNSQYPATLYLYQTNGPVGTSITGTLAQLVKKNATANTNADDADVFPDVTLNTATLPAGIGAVSGLTIRSIIVEGGTLDISGKLNGGVTGAVTLTAGTLHFAGGNYFGTTLTSAPISASNPATHDADISIAPGAILEIGDTTTFVQKFTGNADLAGTIHLLNAAAKIVLAPATGKRQVLSGSVTAAGGSAQFEITPAASSAFLFAGAQDTQLAGTLRVDYAAGNDSTYIYLGKEDGYSVSAQTILFLNSSGTISARINVVPKSSDQFGAGTLLNFSAGSTTPATLTLNGTNQTLAGLVAGNATITGGAIIQNAGAVGGGVDAPSQNTSSAATLTIDTGSAGTAPTYTYNGELRDNAPNSGGTQPLNLVKTGAGTQAIGGIVSLTGTITVTGGTLEFFKLNNTASIGSLITIAADDTAVPAVFKTGTAFDLPLETPVRLGDAGTLAIGPATGTAGTTATFNLRSTITALPGTTSGSVSLDPGTDAFVKISSASITLGKDGTFSVLSGTAVNDTEVNAGAGVNWLANTGALNVAENAAFDIAGVEIRLAGIAGSGDIFSSQPAINGGTFGTDELVLTVGIGRTGGDAPIAFAGSIGSAATGTAEITLRKIGTGTQIITGNGLALTRVLVEEGTLQIGSDSAGGDSGTAPIILSENATYALAAPGNATTISSAEIVPPKNPLLPDEFLPAGEIKKTGPGTAILLGNDARELGGTVPKVTISNGVLQIGADTDLSDPDAPFAVIATTSVVTINSGTLSIAGHKLTIGELAGSGTVSLGNATAAGELTINPALGNTTSFSGAISGNGALIKSGQGRLFLSGTNSYEGATIVNNGALIFQSGKLPSKTAYIGVFNGGTIQFNDATNADATGTLALAGSRSSFAGRPLGSPVQGADILGSLALSGAHVLDVSFSTSNTGPAELAVSGSIALGGNASLRFDFYNTGAPDADGNPTIENDLLTARALAITGTTTTVAINPYYSATTGEMQQGSYLLATLSTPLTSETLSRIKLNDQGLGQTTNPLITELTLENAGTQIYLVVSEITKKFIWSATTTDFPTKTATWYRTLPSELNKWVNELGNPVAYVATNFIDTRHAVYFNDTEGLVRNIAIYEEVTPRYIRIEGDYTFENHRANGKNGHIGTSNDLGTSIEKVGNGTLTLKGDNPNYFKGRFDIKGGVVIVTGTQPLISGKGNTSLLGAATDAASLVISGGAALVFDGDPSNYTSSNRSFTIGAGGATLSIWGADVAFQKVRESDADETVALSPATSASETVRYLTLDALAGKTGTLAHILNDGDGVALAILKTGEGRWRLGGPGESTFTGGISVQQGKLSLISETAAGNSTITLYPGTTLDNELTSETKPTLTQTVPATGTAIKITNDISLLAGTLPNEITAVGTADIVFELAGTISGSSAATLQKSGTGTLALSGDNSAFDGTLNIAQGILRADSENALGNGTTIIADDATLGITGSVTIKNITGTGTVKNLADASATVVFDTADDLVFSPKLADGDVPAATLDIEKRGDATLTLAGANYASGSISITAGTLKFGHAHAPNNSADAGAITVATGATLDIAGTAAGNRTATISGTGVISNAGTDEETAAGALLNSAPTAGTFPKIILAGDATLRSAGNSTIPSATVSEFAPDAALTLAVATGSTATTFLVAANENAATGAIAVPTLNLTAGVTLNITTGTETQPALDTDTNLVFQNAALKLNADVVQTLTSIPSIAENATGTITGDGTLALPDVTGEIALIIADTAKLKLTGATVTLGSTTSTSSAHSATAPAFYFENSTVTLIGTAVNAAGTADVFGKTAAAGGTPSTVVFKNSTLIADANLEIARTLTLAGNSFTLRANTGTSFLFTADAPFSYDALNTNVFSLYLDGDDPKSSNRIDAPLANPSTTLKLNIIKTGTGTWSLAGTNTYTGTTSITNGTLKILAGTALPEETSVILGAYNSQASTGTAGVLDIAGNSVTFAGLTVVNDIPSANALAAQNAVINSATKDADIFLNLSAANTFTGTLGAVAPEDADDDKIAAARALSNFSLILNDTPATNGPYSLTLTGAVALTGEIAVKAGTLFLSGNSSPDAASVISLTSRASLNVTGLAETLTRTSGLIIGPTQTLRAGTATTDATNHIDITGNVTINGGFLDNNITQLTSNTFGGTTLTIAGNLSISAPDADSVATAQFLLTADPTNGVNSLVKTNTLTITLPPYGASRTLTIQPILPDGALSDGNYTLFKFTNTGFGTDITNSVKFDNPDARYTAVIGFDDSSIFLKVTVNASPINTTWSGAETEELNGQTVAYWNATSKNFLKNYTTGVGFFQGDSALFDNTADCFNIVVGTPVTTALVTGEAYLKTGVQFGGVLRFHNDTEHPYTISGGQISGDGYLEKLGAGTLYLLDANDWIGPVSATGDGTQRDPGVHLGNGTIVLGNDRSLGRGSVSVSSSATLATTGNRAIANSVALLNGAELTVDTGTYEFALAGGLSSATVNSRLVITGGGSVSLPGNTTGYKGNFDVQNGTLKLDTKNFAAAELNLAATGVLELHDTGLISNGADTDASLLNGTTRIGALRGDAGSIVRAATGATAAVLETGATGHSTTFAGDFVGNIAVVKIGSGTLTLTGTNANRTGTLAVNGGRVQFGDGTTGGIGSGAISVAAGATLSFYPPAATEITLPALIAGDGTVEKLGDGTLRIDKPSNLAGTVNIVGGTLKLAGDGDLGSARIVADGNLALDWSVERITFSNNVSGTGKIVKLGADNTSVAWVGSGEIPILIARGAFSLGDGETVHNQQNLARIDVAAGATFLISPAGAGTVTVGDVVLHDTWLDETTGAEKTGTPAGTPAGALVKTGTGTATILGATPQKGDVRVELGILEIASTTASTAPVTTVFNVLANGELRFVRAGTTNVEGPLVGAGSFVFSGTGDNSGRTVLLSDANDITGNISVRTGSTLQIGGTNAAGTVVGSTLGTADLTVRLESNATLAFVLVEGQYERRADGSFAGTGENLTITGTGIIEYAGTDPRGIDITSDISAFNGSIIASGGPLSIPVSKLPATATLDASGTGSLRLTAASNQTTKFTPKIGTGDGALVLAPTISPDSSLKYGALAAAVRTGSLATFEFDGAKYYGNSSQSGGVSPENTRFGGTLQIAAGAALHLDGATTRASDGLLTPWQFVVSTTKAKETVNEFYNTARNLNIEPVRDVSYDFFQTVRAATVEILAGAALTGNGVIAGNLIIQNGGLLKPGDSPGVINVKGDLSAHGLLVIDVDHTGATSVVRYSGTADFTGGEVWLSMTEAAYGDLKNSGKLDSTLKIARDTSFANGGADIISVPTPSQIRIRIEGVEEDGSADRFAEEAAYAYAATDGSIALRLADSLDALSVGSNHDLFPHDGLVEFGNYVGNFLNSTDPARQSLIGRLLAGGAVALANASPLGLASMYSMSVTMSHSDNAALWNRARSSYRENATTRAGDTETFFSGYGNFDRNGSGDSDPTFNANTFGGAAGLEYHFGSAPDDLTLGVNGAFHYGKADIHNGGGNVRQDNARFGVHGSAGVGGSLIAAFAVSYGHSTYSIRQHSPAGNASTKAGGDDLSASFFLGGDFKPFGGSVFTLSPFFGVEYVYFRADALRKSGSDAALRVDDQRRDSLRGKLGADFGFDLTGEDCTVLDDDAGGKLGADFGFDLTAKRPKNRTRVRLSFELALTHEFLDTDAQLDIAFAKWNDPLVRVPAASLAENTFEGGPSLELDFNQYTALQIGYRYSTDFNNRETHSATAFFRVRF